MKRRDWIVLGIIMTGLAVIPFVVYGLFRTERIDIDLNSGDVMETELLFGHVSSTTTKETNYSAFVRRELKEQSSRRRSWRQVRESSFLNPISPHFRHGGSVSYLRFFMGCCEDSHVPLEDHRRMAGELLDLLKSDRPEFLESRVEKYSRHILDGKFSGDGAGGVAE